MSHVTRIINRVKWVGIFVAGNIGPVLAEDGFGFVVGYETAPAAFTETALRDSFTAFFGTPPTPAQVDLFRLNLGVSRGEMPPGGVGMAFGATYRQSIGNATATYKLQLSKGSRSFSMPNGFGIFADPASVRMRYTTLSASQDVAWPVLSLGINRELGLELGWGVDATRTSLRTRSALLDVSSTSENTEPFFRAGAVFTLNKADAQSKTRVRMTSYGKALTTITLAQEFAF
jgi:hypothetical protein